MVLGYNYTMKEVSSGRQALSLHELNTLIRSALESDFPEALWVVAEIAELKCNQKGHCYLELIEKDGERTIAQMRATIWAYEYRRIGARFRAVTNETLRPGMKVLLLAGVTFHEVFGMSLNIRDIDPAYTLGEMALKRREIIERLKKEGLFELNKGLPLPLVPQRIAVISSPTAAGYGDFSRQLEGNAFGYAFSHVLFPAVMQGAEAEASVLAALAAIRHHDEAFDLVAIIRGGGSAANLHCFDSYPIAAMVATFPVPVITGIGHEKDDTVVDMVAHTKMKTPTAVAEFVISGARGFEERVMDLQGRLVRRTERNIAERQHEISGLCRRLTVVPLRLGLLLRRLDGMDRETRMHLKHRLQREEDRLRVMEQAVRLLDPRTILRRGYSITRHKGTILVDIETLKTGDVLETQTQGGSVTSIVGGMRKAKHDERKREAELLPGFERA